MPFRICSLLLLVGLIGSTPVYSKDTQLKLRWQDLPRTLEGQKVRIIQRDQRVISGLLDSIGPDALVLNSRSGKSSIARDTVATIEKRGKIVRSRRRFVDTAIGAGVGAVILGIAVTYTNNEGGVNSDKIVGFSGAAAAGTTALGYFAGRISDSDKTVIQIVPEASTK